MQGFKFGGFKMSSVPSSLFTQNEAINGRAGIFLLF